MRAWWIAISMAACGHAGTPAARPKPIACVDRAVAEAEAAAAEQRNQAAFAAALAAGELTPVTIEPYESQPHDETLDWQQVGDQVRAPTGYRACGLGPSHELARDGEGGLWAIVRVPETAGQQDLHACGCLSDVPSHCGGAAPQPVQLVYPIPAGLTFRGTVEVKYPHEVVSVFLVGRADGSACPPLPPPPP